jgi:steroid delta-isomerase-like uncharacterized protein
MSQDLAATMRRFYEESVNQGRMELVDELVADDFVEHEEFPGITGGKEGIKEFFGMMRSAFPDLRFEVEDVVAAGDTVVGRVRMKGTHKGPFMDMPPTGKQIDVPTMDWVRFRDGRAVEHWGVTDTGVMMEQLGAIPAQA